MGECSLTRVLAQVKGGIAAVGQGIPALLLVGDQLGRQDVGSRIVQRHPMGVIAPGSPGIGMTEMILHLVKGHASIKGSGRASMPEQVGEDLSIQSGLSSQKPHALPGGLRAL